ncbi:curlin [Roseibium sp. RKSG952]|uniref:curlin n=1 Tax=Roseibium sp. RKSG952 TaxID=2529384 RepID=UPI0012BC4B17|nr:curlin [Roseibium sp. RKSG952]MTH99292.1 curlin [Roseibium sp. RKSG952]
MKKTLSKAAMVAFLAIAGSAAPALAGGTLSFTLTPQNPGQNNLMRAGLMAAAVANDLSSGGGIKQNGLNNMAGLAQNGFGNQGLILQNGNGHSGSIRQTGSNHAYGLFQFGDNADAHIAQSGHGQTGTTFQFGW